MTNVEFTMWLKGFMDAAGDSLSKEQINSIRQKLDEVKSPPAYIGQPVVPYIPYTPYINPNPYITWCSDKLISTGTITTADTVTADQTALSGSSFTIS